ncbi:UNVERIFIED_ORG: hypothetical protein M2414_004211 [Rahnella aquatilis]
MELVLIKVVKNMVISRQIYGFRGTKIVWISSYDVIYT